jgi:hypothetical protein
MSTNRGTSLNPSRWNEGCSGGFLNPRFTLFVEAEVRTTALTIHKIPDKHQPIHDEIMRLHSSGNLDKDIAKMLDERGIPTPLNRKWSAKLVWHIRKYIRLREERRKDYSLEITSISCVFEK